MSALVAWVPVRASDALVAVRLAGPRFGKVAFLLGAVRCAAADWCQMRAAAGRAAAKTVSGRLGV